MPHHPLPYAFAREHLLLLEQLGDDLTLFWAPASDAPTLARQHSALGEVLRKFGPYREQRDEAGALAQRISAV